MAVRYGATRAEWAAFASLNLVDLLPWVADPNVPIHPASSLKPGHTKTPSTILEDRRGFGVIGYGGWSRPKRRTTSVHDWETEPRFGICMQMRNMQCLDIDVPDKALADRIEGFIRYELGMNGLMMPLRDRENTGKRALFYRLDEGLPHAYQRVVIGDQQGVIEFKSGPGHQMVMAGLHSPGNYYRWPEGIPKQLSDVPAFGVDELIALYDGLWQEFGHEGPYQAWKYVDATINRKSGVNQYKDDPVVQYLLDEDMVLGFSKHNGVYVTCPWEWAHDPEKPSNGTDVEYFPHGANGHSTPGFKCMHAHSRGNLLTQPTHIDFLHAIGYSAIEIDAEFEVTEAPDAPKPLAASRPKFTTKGRSAVIENTISNVTNMLRWEGGGFHFRYDSFKDMIVYQYNGEEKWKVLDDDTYTAIRIAFAQKGMETPAHETVQRAVSFVAREQSMDSAQEWLNAQQWDGVKRVGRFHHDVLRMPLEDDYAQAACEYLWTALAGRILDPGCKADMVPILTGAQGLRKSSLVEAIAPSPDEYTVVTLADRDDNLARQLRGRMVVEWDELRGLNSRDAESLKGWVSRRKDDWIPKFKEFGTTLPRRFVLIGTANPRRFLNDPTGLRRWLPLKITKTIDVDYVLEHRKQLWAEAREMWHAERERTHLTTKTGVMWFGAELLALDAQQDASIRDPWVDAVIEWFDSVEVIGPWTTLEILNAACNVPTSQISFGTQERLRRVMAFMRWDESNDGRWSPPLA